MKNVRFFKKEYGQNYANYQFGYTCWAEMEALAEREALFSQGYLPYSADLQETRALFYLARSLRVDLAALAMDKKRRYLQRQLDQQGAVLSVEPAGQVLAREGGALREAVAHWQGQRFAEAFMPPERLAYLLERPLVTHIGKALMGEETLGYLLLNVWETGAHYWFAFFEAERRAEWSPGKWLLGAFLHWAQTQGLSHAYLGTSYGAKSAYKRQGYLGWEFFDGNGWSRDEGALEALQQQDEARS